MKANDRARVHDALDVLLDALHAPAEAPSQATPGHASALAPLVDKREVARLLAVSPATIDRLVRSGMPHQPVGEVRRFDVAECRAWLADRAKQALALPPASVAQARDSPGLSGVRLLSRAAPRGGR